MNRKLENVAIKVLGIKHGLEIINFFESQGYVNNWRFEGKTNRYYYTNIADAHIHCGELNQKLELTLDQAKELVNPKPELTFPRKMLVGNTIADCKNERLVLLIKDNCFLAVYGSQNSSVENPNPGNSIHCSWWAFAQELPTQQEINQEKIEELKNKIDELNTENARQVQELSDQIVQLKQQNCE